MSLLENLTWRYATKRMNGNTVPQEKLDYILEAARLAPSSSGLQPYKIVVVSNKDIQAKIREVGWDQAQLVEASHLLVFASWNAYTLERIASVFKRTTDERGLPNDAMNNYRDIIWNSYNPLGEEWQAHHTARQAYISFAMAIAAAAEQRVDATPMEGFLPPEVDALLGLDKIGFKSAVILALGYRDTENDWLVNLKKVRTPKEDFIINVV